MKKIIAILLLSTTITFAGVTWFGYYEFESDYAKTPKSDIYFDYNKLRLDLDTNPTRNIHIGGDMIYKNYGGKKIMNISNFMDESFFAGLPQSMIDNMNFEFADSLYIDNLYMDFHHKYFEMIVGRQQLPTGVGYAWNPTDIFNKKDIMDPTYEITGVDAIQLNVPVGSILSLQGIIQPDETFEKSNQFFQAKTWLPFADLALVYAQTSLKNLYGLNVDGDFLGMGVRTEFTANKLNGVDKLKYEYIFGADYTFENSLYILGEYLHSDFGAKENETDIFDYLAYYDWQQKSLNQNYFFLMAMVPITDLLDCSIMSIANLDDKSITINPQLVYRIYQNVEITLMGNIFLGEKTDEFGYQDFGARLRMRAYF